MRNTSIDALKGFGILCVVLGHALQFSFSEFDNNVFFKIIYSFHMPLFFFLSGYVAYETKIYNKCNFSYCIKNKFIHLVIPFLSWYFIVKYILHGEFMDQDLIKYSTTLVYSPDVSLWFLWILFLVFIAVYSYFKIQIMDVRKKIFISLLILSLIILFRNQKSIQLLIYYIPFFMIGYLVSKYWNILEKIFTSSKVFFISIILYALLLIVWKRMPENHHFLEILTVYSIKYITASIAIILLFSVSDKLSKINILSLVGYYSLDIYIIHFSLFFLTRSFFDIFHLETSGSYLYILFCFFTIPLTSIFISKNIISKNSYSAFIFLGKQHKA